MWSENIDYESFLSLKKIYKIDLLVFDIALSTLV